MNPVSALTQINSILTQLRQLTQQDIQAGWRCYPHSSLNWLELTENFEQLAIADLNDKGYIVWEKGHKVQWLIQRLILPSHLNQYPLEGFSLRLKLTWWAEDAKIYVNNQLVQEGDLFDSTTRLLLTSSVIPNKVIWIALRLVSPGHDIGGLMQSQLIFESNDPDFPEPSFIADELAILSQYLESYHPSELERVAENLKQLSTTCLPNKKEFDLQLHQLRKTLKPLTTIIKQSTFHLLGHAHLDMAWLWPLRDTWEAAQRTFQSVLQLQDEFPSLIFGHTSPLLYQWIEKNRPDLFKAILDAYKVGKWEILGGMWVEPDTNLVCGESLIRQLLYGQEYFKEKFGNIAKVAWLTDTFGFTWQLPQILKQSGIEYFVTGKLHWNDTTNFPYGWFKWRSPDKTEILTLMSPPNVAGVMDTNPIVMTNYALKWQKKNQLNHIFWLPGVGDHGGGPTRDMLEVQKRWQKSDFFPNIQFSTAYQYLSQIDSQSSSLPTWENELYLEFHRGCYTTHSEQKLFNRRSENLLYQAELWSSLATIINPTYSDFTSAIQQAWQQVLLNQFHDILPGTSIPEVFEEANKTWHNIIEVSQTILTQSLEAIASHILLPTPPHPKAKPLIIFNSLNWTRSQVISLDIPQEHHSYIIYDLNGNQLDYQVSCENQFLFYAQDIPSIGYRLYWLCPSETIKEIKEHSFANDFILDNGILQVKVNSNTGELDSIFDKIQQREILSDRGNQLQLFQDQGQYWDAWNIDPNYQQYPLDSPQFKSIEWLENGSLQWRIRVTKTFNQSTFIQDYILQAHSPILTIATTIDWQETHVILKTAFPLQLKSHYVSYEIPCATIQRTTEPQTDAEKAKWEVSALHWADLTDETENYGVSLLNDCKYGYDSQPSQLRLTLLRGATWPDPQADQGLHHFNYSLYPHCGNYQTAKTVHQGYEFNIPLQSVVINNSSKTSCLNPVSRLIEIGGDNLILMAFKPSELNPDSWILRCYECHGQKTDFTLQSDLDLKIDSAVNLLEESIPNQTIVNPWKIASFRLK